MTNCKKNKLILNLLNLSLWNVEIVTSVNWIIRLMLSLLIWPKVIQLSGGHCITIASVQIKLQKIKLQSSSYEVNLTVSKIEHKFCFLMLFFIHLNWICTNFIYSIFLYYFIPSTFTRKMSCSRSKIFLFFSILSRRTKKQVW